mmetsp:Transcript_5299/g.15152  ORF Transcript_5299/g.15152 Transcript_5299/m.15152 type:complete len:328 (+) Transcript_5299:592-1575(+)
MEAKSWWSREAPKKVDGAPVGVALCACRQRVDLVVGVSQQGSPGDGAPRLLFSGGRHGVRRVSELLEGLGRLERTRKAGSSDLARHWVCSAHDVHALREIRLRLPRRTLCGRGDTSEYDVDRLAQLFQRGPLPSWEAVAVGIRHRRQRGSAAGDPGLSSCMARRRCARPMAPLHGASHVRSLGLCVERRGGGCVIQISCLELLATPNVKVTGFCQPCSLDWVDDPGFNARLGLQSVVEADGWRQSVPALRVGHRVPVDGDHLLPTQASMLVVVARGHAQQAVHRLALLGGARRHELGGVEKQTMGERSTGVSNPLLRLGKRYISSEK